MLRGDARRVLWRGVLSRGVLSRGVLSRGMTRRQASLEYRLPVEWYPRFW
ncbi:hypothetical protein GCM10027282_10560 [Frigoribacterium salinisoli]